MENGQLSWITNFIWNIADDVLRDLYVRGKYRDVILPMTVLRRLDAVLEPTKAAVMEMKEFLDKERIEGEGRDQQLRAASGQEFYNTSKFTLRDFRARSSRQQLRSDFEAYLDAFSPNVQEILTNFEFRNQIPRLSKADALGQLIEKFLDSSINLGPAPVLNDNGTVKLPGLDNHNMGTMFEELVRRFNEDNNEEAGEHWTPRDAIRLMARLIFFPIADEIQSATYLLYDGACGTGGMLTVAEETLLEIGSQHGKDVVTHLYGQEINPETYAICKADLLLKGEGAAADNIVGGPEHSTLSNDAFTSQRFDFMLSNPPYGKSWKTDLERMGGKSGIKDPRFITEHAGDPEFSLVTRSSDGQLLFLASMISKMKHDTPLGSRIAEVHNGSSLFTGDAGQGESNVRRWIIENDWLEAIIALPLNMFYNTGIATYIWVVSNRKPEHRKGKVQLIDATQWFKPLRKNLGKKNCELSDQDIQTITETFLDFKETEQSKLFPNAAFGYWKITVERPLRLHSQLTRKAIESLRYASGDAEIRAELYDRLGEALFDDFPTVRDKLNEVLSDWGKQQGDDESEGDTAPAKQSIPEKRRRKLADATTWRRDAGLVETANALRDRLGEDLFEDHNAFRAQVAAALKDLGIKLKSAELKLILRAASWRVETAPPVIAKVHKSGKTTPDPLHGRYEFTLDGKKAAVEYETDTELRDTEQVPFMEAPASGNPGGLPSEGTTQQGIESFFRREVLPYAEDAWINPAPPKIGYEISFTRHFYKPQPLRTLDEIRADIVALNSETDGMLESIIGNHSES